MTAILGLLLVVSSVSAAQPQPPSPNILRNSGFTVCTNPGVPDWWGTGAAERIERWEGCYGVAEDSPVPGTRSLRLTSGPGGELFGVQSFAYRAPSGQEYTLSLWLRTPDAGMVARVVIGDRGAHLAVGAEWQRHSFTATPTKGHWAPGRLVVSVGLAKPGTLYIAAPQLELGSEATAYRPADADQASTSPGLERVASPLDTLALPAVACTRVAKGPVLDGRLDDDCYFHARVVSGFVDIATGQPAAVQSECWVLRDRRVLYIAFRCHLPEGVSPSATITRRDGPVFSEDSVEVFLQPSLSGPYIHLATNAAGTRFDELGYETSWNADWRVRTGQQAGEWVAELAIPFASLPLPSAPHGVWRLNLCRNFVDGQARVHSAWSCTAGSFHRPERFGFLKGMATPDLGHFGYEFRGLALEAAANGLVLRGEMVGWPAGARAVRLHAGLRMEPGRQRVGSCTIALPAEARAIPFSVGLGAYGQAPPAGTYELVLRAFDPQAGGLVRGVRRRVTLAGPVGSRVSPLSALCEFSFYTSDPVARVRVNWAGPSGASVGILAHPATGGDAIPLAPVGGGRLSHGQTTLSVPISDLPVGEWILEITVAGTQEATATCRLLKLPPSPTEVRISRFTRALVVNGHPMLVYAQGIHGFKTGWWIPDIASRCFNAIVASFPTWQSDEEAAAGSGPVREFLDECERHNLRVVAWLHRRSDPYPLIREGVVRTIAALRDHPAILCWYLVDEPEGWWESPGTGREESDLIDLYQAAKAADPYRPSHINWYSWTPGRGGYGTLDATDIGSLDRYPLGHHPNPMRSVAEIAALMNEDCRPRAQPTAFWCQMYGYDDAVREPTPAEERCMTYLCLIRGMRLIYYFIYKPMSVDLWASMTGLGQELAALQPLLTDPDARELQVTEAAGDVHYSVHESQGKLVVMAANAGYQTVQAVFDLAQYGAAQKSSAEVLFENRRVRLHRGRLSDSFGPCDRRVYVVE